MAWPNGVRWTGEPSQCTCTAFVAGDLADTLHCPRGWRWVAAIAKWVHS